MGCSNGKIFESVIDQTPKKNEYDFKRDTIMTDSTKHIVKLSNIKDQYMFLKTLGSGAFASVHLVCDKTCSSKLFAVKIISKNSLSKQGRNAVIEEIKILRKLDHINIVKYFDVFEDSDSINIVMEYIEGPTLEEVMQKRRLTEEDMREVVSSIIKALIYIGKLDVVHRDLKPANILFADENSLDSLKIIDFGLSTFKKNNDSKTVGSPIFMSPESTKGRYMFKSDIWSLGVICFLLITDEYPFNADDRDTLFEVIRSGLYDATKLAKSEFSRSAVDFVKNCLSVENRMSAIKAIKHPFLSEVKIEMDMKDVEQLIINITKFSKLNVFMKEVFFYLAKLLCNDSKLKEIKEMFEQLDHNNNGIVKLQDITRIVQKAGKTYTAVVF